MKQRPPSKKILRANITRTGDYLADAIKRKGGFALRMLLVFLMGVMLTTGLLATYFPAVSFLLSGIAALAGMGGGTAFFIWYRLISKTRYWAHRMGWQVLLVSGIGLLYYSACHQPVFWIGAGISSGGTILFFRWLQKARPGRCSIYKELGIVLSTLVLPILEWALYQSALRPCIDPWMNVLIILLDGLIAFLVLCCIRLFNWSSWLNHV